MSIVALKRKTAAQHKNNSANVPQFSINGTHRSQGWVGQDTRGRFLSRTLMKGNVIRGHGGCCGKYPVLRVVQTSVTTTENPKIVKPSVLNNSGMISTQYRWVRRPQPYSVVKPDDNNNINTQQQYIENLQKQAINTVLTCPGATDKPTTRIPSGTCGGLLPPQRAAQCILTKEFSEPNVHPKFLSQSDYLQRLNKSCGVLLDIKYVPSKTNHTPFACSNVK